jgi:hypothetical protein
LVSYCPFIALPDAAGFLDIHSSYACPICASIECSSLWALDHHLRVIHQATIQAKPATVAVNILQQLSSFGLGYDHRHSILICLHAAEGIPQRDVQQHLAKCAHHVITNALCALLDSTNISDVDDPLPLAIGTPIPTIIPESGYQCEECKLSFTAPKTQPKKKN